MSSHQYPLPPASSVADVSQPAYAPTYHTLPQQPSSIVPYAASGARLSQSSNTRLHHQPTQFGTLTDKRKNKLGYHRTTVACGNCRRRKIRCAPGPLDDQNRCANCVRMNKDCIFYPVDQPPPTELQAELAPLTSSTEPKGTASLSPEASSGNLAKHSGKHPLGSIPQRMRKVLPSNFKSGNVEVHSPEAKVTLGSSMNKTVDFGGQPVANWIHADLSRSPISNPADLNQTWRGYPPESPMSAQFSPFGPATPTSTWVPGDAESDSQGDMPWGNYPPPGRSMSYGGEPLTGQHPIQYPPGSQSRQFDRRASMFPDMYTPSMAMPMPGMETSGGLGTDPLGQLPAGGTLTEGFGAWNQPQPPQQSSYPYPAWGYGEPGQPMQAEPGHHLSDNEPPPDVYYPPR